MDSSIFDPTRVFLEKRQAMHPMVVVDRSICRRCNLCRDVSICVNANCVGCLACYYACPYEARRIVEDGSERRFIRISVDGVEYTVPERITLKEALKLCGYSFDVFPGRSGLYSPCGLGGCWACSILVDGVLTRSCITGVRDRMKIETNGSDTAPLGIIHGPEPHTVGVKLLPSLKVGVWINM